MLGNFNSPQASKMQTFYSPSSTVKASDFRAWTSQNHYRTSTSDMTSPDPVKNKTSAIPGYQGTIPGTKSDNNFAKTFAKISREQFSRPVYLPPRTLEFFPNRPVQSSIPRTSGKFGGGLEDEYHTVSRFHGKSTLLKEHPNYVSDPWSTSSKEAFKPQEDVRKHTFRTTNLGKWKNTKFNENENTKSSGFIKNWLVCDGKGWLPVKSMHGDMTRTEYRTKFNNEVPFHPLPLNPNPRKMKKDSNLAS